MASHACYACTMQVLVGVLWFLGFFGMLWLDGAAARLLLGVVWLALPVVYILGQRSVSTITTPSSGARPRARHGHAGSGSAIQP